MQISVTHKEAFYQPAHYALQSKLPPILTYPKCTFISITFNLAYYYEFYMPCGKVSLISALFKLALKEDLT